MNYADCSVINLSRRSLLLLLVVIATLSLLTGCWVQSVYPFHTDSDVVVDSTLTGKWVGDTELKDCALTISLDSDTQTYRLEVSSLLPASAKPGLGVECEPATLRGQLVQLGSTRYLDITLDPDKSWPAPLDTIVKLELSKQELTLTPLDAEWMSNAISNDGLKLQARVQESDGLLPMVAVTLVSPTGDLRDFLLHADAAAFSRSDQMRFLRK